MVLCINGRVKWNLLTLKLSLCDAKGSQKWFLASAYLDKAAKLGDLTEYSSKYGVAL
jgi:hypothetical protein